MRKYTNREYTNSEITRVIDEYIHNAKDRMILKRRLIDGATYEQIAEEAEIHETTCRRKVYKLQNVLFKHL